MLFLVIKKSQMVITLGLLLALTGCVGNTSGTANENDSAVNYATTSVPIPNNLIFCSNSSCSESLTSINLAAQAGSSTPVTQNVYVKNIGADATGALTGAYQTQIDGLTATIPQSCSSGLAVDTVCPDPLIFSYAAQSVAVSGSDTYNVSSAALSTSFPLTVNYVSYPPPTPKEFMEYWCGFSLSFCGQSSTNDINPKTTIVVLAFANIEESMVVVDTTNWPTTLITNWQQQGKKVILSIGGQNVNWTTAFASTDSIDNFTSSINAILTQYNLDGVDLDIENGNASVTNVIYAINSLKQKITPKILTIAPQNVGVYQPNPFIPNSTTLDGWSYFVPVLNGAIQSIDYVAIQAYNNWYGGGNYNPSAASVDYLMNSYLNWLNSPNTLFNPPQTPIANFAGVPESKLIIGILASSKAGGSAFAPTPTMLESVVQTLSQPPYNNSLAGYMMWDSYWDESNSYEISDAAINALGL